MIKHVMIATLVCLAAIPVVAQSRTSPVDSPKKVVDQFCRLDAEGGQLTPKRWDELTAFFSVHRPWHAPSSILVIRNYEVGDPRELLNHPSSVAVKVDYFYWGSLDLKLHFTLRKGPVSGEPMKVSEDVNLILADKYQEPGASAKEDEKQGTLRWRIDSLPPPHITVETAIRYITEMRSKSDDPLVHYNADRTLAYLKSILAGASVPMQPLGTPQEPPDQVLQRFCKLETSSEGLTPNGRRELARFFVETPKPQWDKILIVENYRLSDSGIEGDHAGFGVEYEPVGLLDSSLRLTDDGLDKIPLLGCCSEELGYTLLLSEKYWDTEPDGTSLKERNGPLAWRIDSYPPIVWITVDTAIRYVKEMREKSGDLVTKKTADDTLAKLLKLHYYSEH